MYISYATSLFIIVFPLSLATVVHARNLPHTIPHEKPPETAAPSPPSSTQAIREAEYRLQAAKKAYERARINNQKFQNLSSPNNSYSQEKWRAEHELLRAKQNMWREQSNLNTLKMRQQNIQRQQQRKAQPYSNRPGRQFDRSYPTIELRRK